MTLEEEKRMLQSLKRGDYVRFKADETITGRKVLDHRLGMLVVLGKGETRHWDYSYLTCDAIETLKKILHE